ncbi:MAG: hypothetical protein QW267_05915, partial [Sulfolobales archaeon]
MIRSMYLTTVFSLIRSEGLLNSEAILGLINKGVSIGRRVVIYGGNISALAAAGQALRDGAEVYLI